MFGLKAAVMLDYILTPPRGRNDPVHALGELVRAAQQQCGVTDARAVRLHDCVYLLRTDALRNRRDTPLFVSLDGSVPALLREEASQQVADACATTSASKLSPSGAGVVPPSVHGFLLGYPVVYTFRDSARARLCLAGADVEVFRILGACVALPAAALLSSCSVPTGAVPQELLTRVMHGWSASACAAAASSDGVWADITLTRDAQSTHAIVL